MNGKRQWTEFEDSLLLRGATYSKFVEITKESIGAMTYYRRKRELGCTRLGDFTQDELEWLAVKLHDFDKTKDLYSEFIEVFPMRNKSRRSFNRMLNKCGIKPCKPKEGERYYPLELRQWVLKNAEGMCCDEVQWHIKNIFGIQMTKDHIYAMIDKEHLNVKLASSKNRRFSNGIALEIPDGMKVMFADGDKKNFSEENVFVVPINVYQRVNKYQGVFDSEMFSLIVIQAKLKATLWDAKKEDKK